MSAKPRKYKKVRPEVARGSNARRIARPEVTRAAQPLELGVLFDHFSIDDLAKRTASHAGRYGRVMLRITPAMHCTLFVAETAEQKRAFNARPFDAVGFFEVRDMNNPLVGRPELVDLIAEEILGHLHDLRERARADHPRAA